jgi:hypothetical protein
MRTMMLVLTCWVLFGCDGTYEGKLGSNNRPYRDASQSTEPEVDGSSQADAASAQGDHVPSDAHVNFPPDAVHGGVDAGPRDARTLCNQDAGAGALDADVQEEQATDTWCCLLTPTGCGP